MEAKERSEMPPPRNRYLQMDEIAEANEGSRKAEPTEGNEGSQKAEPTEDSEELFLELDTEVVEYYTKAGEWLSMYTFGALPRTVTAIHRMKNWEDVLQLTMPVNWTPLALYEVTKIFSVSRYENKAQRFYMLVLLPRVRDDIQKNGSLGIDLQKCLKRASSKPAVFIKGIILPLCQSGTCSDNERLIFSRTLRNISTPIQDIDLSAVLVQLSNMDYWYIIFFIMVFLAKERRWSCRVIDAIVAHFMRFLDNKNIIMPVKWHQEFLAFMQRYKRYMSKEARHDLNCLLQKQQHQHPVAFKILKELANCP